MFDIKKVFDEIDRLVARHGVLETAVSNLNHKRHLLELDRGKKQKEQAAIRADLEKMAYRLPLGGKDAEINRRVEAVLSLLEKYEVGTPTVRKKRRGTK